MAAFDGKTAVLVELDYCVGCYACQSACQAHHDLPVKETYLRNLIMKPERVDGKLEDFMSPIPLALNHCEECIDSEEGTPCTKICIGKALHIGSFGGVLEEVKDSNSRFALYF